MNYYNEFDPKAAAWLRELIKQGHIPKGEVDERSVVDVRGADLTGYNQCHFFAGIGGWAVALALAGWPPDRPVWTGSCPCQPFSAAGKKKGTADKRHLWPEFRRLISERNPAVILGEQVASKAGREWLAGVRADLEGLAYGVGAADLCAACKGSPHIRQRLWWVADAGGRRCEQCDQSIGELSESDTGSSAGRLAESDGREPRHSGIQRGGEYRQLAENGGIVGLGNTDKQGPQGWRQHLGEHASELSAGQTGAPGWLGDAERAERGPLAGARGDEGRQLLSQREEMPDGSGESGTPRWLGDTAGSRRTGDRLSRSGETAGDTARLQQSAGSGTPCGLADAEHDGGRPDQQGRGPEGRTADGRPRGLGDTARNDERRERERGSRGRGEAGRSGSDRLRLGDTTGGGCGIGGDEALAGSRGYSIGSSWAAFDLIYCTDGKTRRIEPGTFPLAHGIPARVGRLRGYGNAIVPQVAAEFIAAYMAVRSITRKAA